MILHTNNPSAIRFIYLCPECHVTIKGSEYRPYMNACDDHRLYHARLDALSATGRVNAITDHGNVPAHTTSSYTRLEGVVSMNVTANRGSHGLRYSDGTAYVAPVDYL